MLRLYTLTLKILAPILCCALWFVDLGQHVHPEVSINDGEQRNERKSRPAYLVAADLAAVCSSVRTGARGEFQGGGVPTPLEGGRDRQRHISGSPVHSRREVDEFGGGVARAVASPLLVLGSESDSWVSSPTSRGAEAPPGEGLRKGQGCPSLAGVQT